MDLKSASKFLSYVLRHHPEVIGVGMDRHGWVKVSELIKKAEENGHSIDRQTIKEIMDQPGRQRFILNEDGTYIRAGYGHSVDVDLQLHPEKPPEILYHGTAQQNLDSILENGIHSAGRNFVHLSATEKEAIHIGRRHGKPVILSVLAEKMHDAGHSFYRSDSEAGIWLVSFVPTEFVNS
ncbi:MAG TPA: RNA 2'-phosphotransferase [Balneolaceae bacterium]|nr:RNA 2'-phosphotransferase [Balneolaceae bacterium]